MDCGNRTQGAPHDVPHPGGHLLGDEHRKVEMEEKEMEGVIEVLEVDTGKQLGVEARMVLLGRGLNQSPASGGAARCPRVLPGALNPGAPENPRPGMPPAGTA